ncbi:hypothetical protein [Kutzneria buriramensis]|uniref:hypothetical protein n=1 Tax=Kutzneria buriramensis TaxID=1045776 RepID=UPI000E233FCF|nr:hypothetical protein [Kutzneria buriramensis]
MGGQRRPDRRRHQWGLAFLGVPLRLDFVDTVRRRSGSASVLHGQILDRWRLLEFGLPRNAVVDAG